jgi:hypothetical protein
MALSSARHPTIRQETELLDMPSRSLDATTGFPIKEAGEVPREMACLASEIVAGLENLSIDISLAARNA